MTLSVAWVRDIGNTQELLVATDSRLRFGCAWDCCPKIITLPRSDSALCFAGDTMHAYPMMLQMQAAIGMYPKSRSRAMDFLELRHHTLEVFNGMREYIGDLRGDQQEPEPPETLFILAGFSWRSSKFAIWLLHFDTNIKQFTYRPASTWKGGDGKKKIAFAGDYVEEARTRLVEILREREKLTVGGFDMEPFEVLRDMLRDDQHPYIGGPPQLVKVYRHMNSLPFGVYWPDRESGQVSLLGRPLLNYETSTYKVLDPDTLKTDAEHNLQSVEEI